MTPLRRQMIRELELHRKAPDTVMSYVKAVEELARHYDRSPDQISKEEVRDVLHHAIIERKLACSTVNHKLAGAFWGQTDVSSTARLSICVVCAFVARTYGGIDGRCGCGGGGTR